MSSLLTQSAATDLSPPRRRFPLAGAAVALGGAAAVGAAVAHQPLLGLLACGLAAVVFAVPFVDGLAVMTFWLLPYLILNLPTGGLTLKVPEVTAYLFAASAVARALLRREPISLPPATPQVLIYFAVLCLSAAAAPAVPKVNGEFFSGIQGPQLRSVAMIFWLALSWLVVVGLYHVVGTSPSLFRRCVRAHVLGGALASLIGIVGYVSALRGGEMALLGIGHSHSFVFTGGSFYRLTGVSYEPLVFAFYLVTVIPATLAVLLYHPDWVPRRLAILALLLQGLALMLTFSAGGWVALTVGGVLLAVLFRPERLDWSKMWPTVLALSLLVGLLVLLFHANAVLSNTIGNAVSKITSGGYKQRNDEIITGMRMFHDFFWLRTGPGMTVFFFPLYHPVVRSMDNPFSVYIANLYVTTLAESGIVGFLALSLCGLFGLAALAQAVRGQGPKRVPVLTALTVSLVGCAIQYWEMINLFVIYFPALVGLAVAGGRLAQTRAERAP